MTLNLSIASGVQVTPPPIATGPTYVLRFAPLPRAPNQLSATTMAGIALGAALTIAVLLVLALVGAKRLSSDARDNSAAPKDSTKPVTILFTDIESSTKLWACCPEDMGTALDHHHAVIRACIKRHGGYEVKTVGDCFMIAIADAAAAVRLALDIEASLWTHPWATDAFDRFYEEVLGTGIERKGSDADMATFAHHNSRPNLWRGLRVRIGMHAGLADVKFDETTKGYDYYGNTVNVASRIEDSAHGGQILASREVLELAGLHALPEDASATGHTLTRGQMTPMILAARSGSDVTPLSVTDCGRHEVRGVPEPVSIFELASPELCGRQFPPIRVELANRAEEEGNHSDASVPPRRELAASTASRPTDTVASSRGSSTATKSITLRRRAVFETIFASLLAPCKPAMRRQMLTDLAYAWRIDQAAVAAKDEAHRRESAVLPTAKGTTSTTMAMPGPSTPHSAMVHALTVKVVAVCADHLNRLESQFNDNSPCRTPHDGNLMPSIFGSREKLVILDAHSTSLVPDGTGGLNSAGPLSLCGDDSTTHSTDPSRAAGGAQPRSFPRDVTSSSLSAAEEDLASTARRSEPQRAAMDPHPLRVVLSDDDT